MKSREEITGQAAGASPGGGILAVDGLRTVFHGRHGAVTAVDGVSLSVSAGRTLGVVGESGCGKSVMALSIMRLIPPRLGSIEGGTIRCGGRDLLQLSDAEMHKVRGAEISMIFQEPMTALNPVLTIGQQIVETVRLHTGVTRRQARDRAIEMLRLVQIAEAERHIDSYPHQLSGGMRQRAMIAMALSCNPKVLIADEPTTALDVTIQAQILELLKDLQTRLGTAVIMITHDLGVIAETAQRVAVMYAGRKVEEADVESLFDTPLHPYTRGLMKAIPTMDVDDDEPIERRRLHTIDGTVPALHDMPEGCSFAPRCHMATTQCRRERPILEEMQPDRWVACWHAERPR